MKFYNQELNYRGVSENESYYLQKDYPKNTTFLFSWIRSSAFT